ncbi:MAG TPA: cytochrome c biogenesis protein CcdA [Terriglobales bacterium]|jgi:cytochrome c-type biogenesis protein|nr:cytochrome c biogenesis protein CcdA [Terriglobales bacterium]
MSSLPLPIAAFLAGLISFLSPCVLPLVPGYVSLISGAGMEELKEGTPQLRKVVMLNSIMFILGFSVIFISLGAAAAGVGSLFGSHRSLLLRIGGVVIILFGLHLTGLVPIKMLYADKRMHSLKANASLAGAFLVGLAFAFGWSPCVGPILSLILGLAAVQGGVTKSVFLLGLYSLGLAVPFLLTTVAIGRFFSFYTRIRQHLHKIEVGSGVIMMALGVLIVSGHFLKINGWLNKLPFFQNIVEKFL